MASSIAVIYFSSEKVAMCRKVQPRVHLWPQVLIVCSALSFLINMPLFILKSQVIFLRLQVAVLSTHNAVFHLACTSQQALVRLPLHAFESTFLVYMILEGLAPTGHGQHIYIQHLYFPSSAKCK